MPDISLATFATLADVRRLLGEPQDRNPDDAQGDMEIMECLRFATRFIQQRTGRDYLPRVETRYFDVGIPTLGADAGGYVLDLGESNRLLEVTTLTDGDGTTYTTNDYRLYPREGPPYTEIRLGYNAWTIDAVYEGKQAIAVAGRWESSDRNAANWLASYDTVQNDPLSSSATSITVAWSTAYDPARRTPRFSPGQLVRLGTSEYAAVLDTNYVVGGTSTITVRRAERGTTAAEHATATAISAWEVDDNIRMACAELARWKYKGGNTADGIPQGITDMIGGIAPRYFVRAI